MCRSSSTRVRTAPDPRRPQAEPSPPATPTADRPRRAAKAPTPLTVLRHASSAAKTHPTHELEATTGETCAGRQPFLIHKGTEDRPIGHRQTTAPRAVAAIIATLSRQTTRTREN